MEADRQDHHVLGPVRDGGVAVFVSQRCAKRHRLIERRATYDEGAGVSDLPGTPHSPDERVAGDDRLHRLQVDARPYRGHAGGVDHAKNRDSVSGDVIVRARHA
jgi:hypothetical protein